MYSTHNEGKSAATERFIECYKKYLQAYDSCVKKRLF